MSIEFAMNEDDQDYIAHIEHTVSPKIGEENELDAGEYILVVPEGQRAIVIYEDADA